MREEWGKREKPGEGGVVLKFLEGVIEGEVG